jgi:ribosomal protein S19
LDKSWGRSRKFRRNQRMNNKLFNAIKVISEETEVPIDMLIDYLEIMPEMVGLKSRLGEEFEIIGRVITSNVVVSDIREAIDCWRKNI